MTGPAWAEELSDEAAARLRRAVAHIAASSGCIGWGTAWRITAARPDDVAEHHVVQALAGLGVRVADLPRLPTVPPAVWPPWLPEDVSRLRLRLSAQVVFDNCIQVGFRVVDGFALDDGRRIDAAAIERARRHAPATADPSAAERVLTHLRAVVDTSDAMADLVLWEVLRLLRPLRPAGLGQREIRKQATVLGVVPSEADLLAAALVEESGHLAVDDGLPAPATSWTTTLPALDVPRTPDTAHPVRVEPEVEPTDPSPTAPAAPDSGTAASRRLPTGPPEIAVRPGRPGHVRVVWSAPPDVDVLFRRAAHPPREKPGEIVPIASVWAHGEPEPTSGAALLDGGRMGRDVPIPDEPAHLTVYAVVAEAAVVGNTVALSDARPVESLQVDRFGRQAVLGWGWSPGAVAALVSWTFDGEEEPAAPPMRCARRDLERGLRITIGHRGVTFSVRAVYGFTGQEVRSPPEVAHLGPIGVFVRYEIHPREAPVFGFLRQRRCQIRVTAENDCTLPDILIVEGHDTRRPRAADAGDVLDRLTGRAVAAGETVTKEVEIARRGPTWLVCFTDPAGRPDADAVVLENPPESEMRRR